MLYRIGRLKHLGMLTMITVILLLICSNSIQSELKNCATGGSIGPCLAGHCPLSTTTWINTNDGEICCNNSMITSGTTIATTTTISEDDNEL
ncbi:hypothetical protein DICVIV_13417 [Dictyocaulus viviparus]|uniref:CC domain-containing protein n=1 Tax=Dictyocaulus viviparus TaxID=29172 RepID=A0A0D8XAF9_DICVI|nr:hypothetical protein DICVIV_13417 [Dictyocaulus viviparus]